MSEMLYKQACSCMPCADECLTILNIIRKSSSSKFTQDILLKPLALARHSDGEKALEKMVKIKILSLNEGVYQSCMIDSDLNNLSYLLAGMDYQRNLVKKDTREIVLTLPRSPSSLEDAVKKQGLKAVRIQKTEDIFEYLAHKCKRSLTVMTPFLDEDGAKFLINLYKSASANVEKNLILRFLSFSPSSSLYPSGYPIIRDELTEMGVRVFDYAIARPAQLDSLETFHSKTILSDSDLAYIGSANINKHSLANSMELGTLLTGESVTVLSLILESVMSISRVENK